jgi:hypothetical protein
LIVTIFHSHSIIGYDPRKDVIFNRYKYPFDDYNNISAKLFFEHLNYNHTSIDINGDDGSLQFDVRRDDLYKQLSFKFDVITNLGFTEHVGEGDVEENLLRNQYVMFKNMHELGISIYLSIHFSVY